MGRKAKEKKNECDEYVLCVNNDKKKRTRIFLIVHSLLFALVITITSLGINLIPQATILTEFIYNHIEIIFLCIFVICVFDFVIMIIYTWFSNDCIGDIIDKVRLKSDTLINTTNKKIEFHNNSVEQMKQKIDRIHEETIELCEYNRKQNIHILYNIKAIEKEVKLSRSDLEKSRFTRKMELML